MATDRRTFLAQSAGAMAAMAISPQALLGRQPRADAGLGVGVIGVGRQGRSILGELEKFESVVVRALCDSDVRRLDSGVRRSAGAEGVSDFRAVLDRDDVGAVFIATPTHLHKQIAIDALSAGKHVYCEAPLAHTLEDCRAIVGAARGGSQILQPGLQARSNPMYQLAWSFYRSDAVRDVVAMRGQRFRKTSWRTPASDPARERELNWRLDPEVSIGLAGEWGTHQFDVYHWFTGEYPKSVQGMGGIRLHEDGREIHDTINCTLDFGRGVGLQYQASLANSYEGQYEVLRGTNATIKLAWTAAWMFKEADAPTQGWEVYANRQQFHNDEGITLIADATKLAEQGKLKEGVRLPNPPLYYSVNDFLMSVIEGQTVVVTPEEGLRATAVGIAAHQAVITGETMKIDEEMLRAS